MPPSMMPELANGFLSKGDGLMVEGDAAMEDETCVNGSRFVLFYGQFG